MGESDNRENEDISAVRQYNEAKANEKNVYTLEEVEKFVKEGLVKLIDFKGGKQNFIIYNYYAYEKRRGCPDCYEKTRNSPEYWFILGRLVEQNVYLPEEIAKLTKEGKVKLIDFKESKENFVTYGDLAYEKRQGCLDCHEKTKNSPECWFKLGKRIEENKEGGLKQNVKKTSEEDGSPKP